MDQKEQSLRNELKELDLKLQDPAIFSDKSYPKLAKRKAQLDDIITLFDKKNKLAYDLKQTRIIAGGDDRELSELAKLEIPDLEEKFALVENTLSEALTPRDRKSTRLNSSHPIISYAVF